MFRKVKKEIRKVDKKISDLCKKRKDLIKKSQKECKHPEKKIISLRGNILKCDKCGLIVSTVTKFSP